MMFSRSISRVKWLSGEQGTRTKMVFETLVCSPLNHLTRLIARENFIILSLRESNKSQVRVCLVRLVHNTYCR
jgi:hypothetical protein